MTFGVDQPQQIQDLLSDRRIRLKGNVPELLSKNLRCAVGSHIQEVRPDLSIALASNLHSNAELPVNCCHLVTRQPLQKSAAPHG